MQNLKYISPIFEDIYTKKYVTHKGTRLKTSNIITLIDMFLNRYIYFNKDNIKLNSRVLKFLYGSTYSKYIEYLIDNQFIFLYKNYSSGLKSKCYKLTDKSKGKGYLSVNVNIPIKLQNKIRLVNDSNYNTNEFIKNKLINDLYQINIDLEQTKIWIDKNLDKNDKAYFINSTCCARIANKDIYYSFDNYGRFHTNFTVLKKDIRSNFLKFGKEKIKEIDITNSQPFFLYLLMRNSNFTNFNGFDLDVLSGVIYDKIKNITGINRKEVKTNVYSVLFGRNMSKDYWNDLFNKLYPDVYKWIVDYKKINKSYKIIAHELQRIESDFMFNNLIPRIVAHNKDIRVITIHDSVMVQEKYYNDVKIIFNECLKSLI